METLPKLPIGIQDFKNIRLEGYLYVDKTALIHKLVSTGSFYFLARPRRFGKSLLLSTLHAYFDGEKSLFDGLEISRLKTTEWTKRPVLHLDLNIGEYKRHDDLVNKLSLHLTEWEEIYGAKPAEISLGDRFAGVIRRAYEQTGQQVAILVDEYDKPVVQAIDDEKLQDSFRTTLKSFYSALKSMNGCISFALLTGVTKLGKVSVFSDLNNLYDISMDQAYVGICGITEEEMNTTMTPYVELLAEKIKKTTDETRQILRTQYDGYHFCENTIGIYNPFSLLNTFKAETIKNYWFETGTPSYLAIALRNRHYNLEHMSTVEVGADTLNSVDAQSVDIIPLIYQSGYLTIKAYDERFKLYTLGFPNKEVEDGFMYFLLPYYTHIKTSDTGKNVERMVRDIEEGKIDTFLHQLSSLFADTPYELIRNLENHYQNVLFIVAKLIGLYTKAEYHTSQGRIDMVIQTEQFTYVMEFKLDGTAEDALKQIKERNYAQPFENDPSRHTVKVGVNFSSSTRNIERWLVEK
jgi:hypothetical protein